MRDLRAALGDGNVVLDVRMLEMSLSVNIHRSLKPSLFLMAGRTTINLTRFKENGLRHVIVFA